jgi:protein TonB
VASPASNASRGHETGAAAAVAPASTNRPAVDVTALTTRDDFLLELGEALGGQASVRPVDSISSALEYLSSTRRGQLLVLDARDVADVRAAVESVQSQAPHAVVLVFASAEIEKQVNAAVKGSTAFAVLPVPIDKRKTAAVLDSAMSDAVARKATARPGAAAVTVESFQPRLDGGTPPPHTPEKSKAPLWLGVGIAAVAIAGGAYYFLGKGSAPHSAPTAQRATTAAAQSAPAKAAPDVSLEPAPAADTSIVKGKVDELLEKARLAMRERRFLEPNGDNALVYYRSAAAADPTSGEAKDGMQRVASVAATRFEEAMNNGKYEEASLALANLKISAPDEPRTGGFELKLFNAQIGKALADGNLERASALTRQAQGSPNISADQLAKARADIARRQEDAKVQRLAALASDRIRDGRLADPADDSAKAYVQQLHEAAPSSPVTQRAVRELNAAYLRKAHDAAIAKNNADVDRWIAEARAGGVSAAEINSLQRDLVTVRQKAAQAEADRLVQVTRDRMREGRLSDPANDSATYYLTQLQSADPGNAQLAVLSRELAGKLLDRARAAAGKAGGQVDTDLTLAKRWGAEQKDIQAIQTAQAPSAKPATASRSTSGLTLAQLAATLKRTKYSPPEYPSKALSQRIGGTVTIEYVVGTNGDPRDVRVVEATPPGVFDKAAITAIKRWHYEPVIVNGAPVEVPVRTAIKFELPPQ